MAEQKRLFRSNTRQNRQKVGTIAFAASGGNPLELPRVGYLNRIFLNFRGTITNTGAGTLTDLGPWNLLNRIRVQVNVAAAALVDLTGYGAFLVSGKIDRAFLANAAGAGATTPHADNYVAPLANGANTWSLWYVLPIAANQGSNFESGLINLQAPEVRVTVEPIFGAITDPSTTISAITGNLHVYYEYFEVPDPRTVQQPYPMLHRLLEDQISVQAGENIYTLPRQGNLLQMIHYLRLNGARSDSFDSSQIRFNKTTFPYSQERQLTRLVSRMHNATDWPTGVFDYDFFHGMESLSMGDGRDKVDTEELATVESVVQLSSGAVLGANNNFLNTVRRITQLFQ